MFVEPMLLTERPEPFSDERYIFEPKIDGHRLIVGKTGGDVRLYTRHQTDVTLRYPELLTLQTPSDVVLDGEVCCLDDSGRVDFELVMKRFQTTKKDRITRMADKLPVFAVIFDVMFYKGQDLRTRPLMERRRLLHEILPQQPHYTVIPHTEEDGNSVFASVTERKIEGMVAKKKDSLYIGKRSKEWLKIIRWEYLDVVIIGYRRGDFGWYVGVPESEGVRPIGIVELGVPPKAKQAFYAVAQDLVIKRTDKAVWLEPRIRIRVKFRNYTHKGFLRTPSFVEFIL